MMGQGPLECMIGDVITTGSFKSYEDYKIVLVLSKPVVVSHYALGDVHLWVQFLALVDGQGPIVIKENFESWSIWHRIE